MIVSNSKTIPAFATILPDCEVMCDCQQIIGEINMTKTQTESTFKSRKDFRTFVAEAGKKELEEIIGSNLQILSVSEESTDEKADILAVCNIHERTVIECELKQNIKTLAGLLKHASSYNAKNILWLVNQEIPDAIDTASWLSKIISHEVKLYIVKCFIKNDEVCFKPLLIPSANTYQRPKAKITNTKENQEKFWQEFQKYTTENNHPLKINPATQHWQYVSIGMQGVSIQLTINTTKNNLGCELLIANDKELFYKLEGHKKEIEKQLGKLDWQALEGKKSSRIRTTMDFNIETANNEEGILWLINTTDKFKDVFSKHLA